MLSIFTMSVSLFVCFHIFGSQHSVCECSPVADMSSSLSLREQLSKEQREKAIEIEKVKIRLLNHLHMREPPKVKNSTLSPEEIFNALPNYYKNKLRDEMEPKVQESDPEELILKAKPMLSCIPGAVSSCFVIDILDDLPRRSIISAKLYADRESESLVGKHLELWEIQLVGSTINFVGPVISSTQVVEDENQPISFEFSAKLAHWLRSRDMQRRTQRKISRSLAIMCIDCSNENQLAIVESKTILEIKYRSVVRQKRSIYYGCSNNLRVRCCKQTLTISFSSIGWNRWVAYPPNITPNYCQGSCSDGSYVETSHADLMHLYSLSSNLKSEDLQPCCAARSLSSFTLVYITDNGAMHLKSIPNMIVDSCGCI